MTSLQLSWGMFLSIHFTREIFFIIYDRNRKRTESGEKMKMKTATRSFEGLNLFKNLLFSVVVCRTNYYSFRRLPNVWRSESKELFSNCFSAIMFLSQVGLRDVTWLRTCVPSRSMLPNGEEFTMSKHLFMSWREHLEIIENDAKDAWGAAPLINAPHRHSNTLETSSHP